MMKNYRKYILLLLALSPLFAACDDMLNVTPKDRLTPSDYFKDENELELYSNRMVPEELRWWIDAPS